MPNPNDNRIQLAREKDLKSVSIDAPDAPQSKPEAISPILAFMQFQTEASALFTEIIFKLRDADGEIARLRTQVERLQATLEARDSSLAEMKKNVAEME